MLMNNCTENIEIVLTERQEDDSIENFTRMEAMVKKTYYTYERYNTDATFALLYHEHPLDVQKLSEYIRISDHIIKINEHMYFLIFAYTNAQNAYKASQNILMGLDAFFGNQTTCIALDDYSVNKSAFMVFNRLKMILKETRKSSYTRIESEDILEAAY